MECDQQVQTLILAILLAHSLGMQYQQVLYQTCTNISFVEDVNLHLIDAGFQVVGPEAPHVLDAGYQVVGP